MAVAAAAFLIAATISAQAQLVTVWLGGSGDWSNPGKWTSGFPNTTSTQGWFLFQDAAVNIVGTYAIDGLEITGADFNFSLNTASSMTFHGIGISANVPTTFSVSSDSTLNFLNSSSASRISTSVALNNYGTVNFRDTSTAGNATITNGTTISGATITFEDNATAGSANITNQAFSTITFSGNSSAGTSSAVFNNLGAIEFQGNSTAGYATIHNNADFVNFHAGDLQFKDNSSAANATITSWNTITFSGSSTAANATITTYTDMMAGLFSVTSFRDNSSAGYATIVNGGYVNFLGSSTAANSTITNNLVLQFLGSSTAGNATIINNNAAVFSDFSTAGNATFTNNGTLEFVTDSKAGTSRITNNSYLLFTDRSSAENVTITNVSGVIYFSLFSTAANATITNDAGIVFYQSATAGNATIINNLQVYFFDSSTAGNSTITVNNGADLIFLENSTGGTSRLIVNAGGMVDFTGTTGPNNDGIVTVGSLEGAGLVGIGNTTLYVGGNNLSTTFSGEISNDCGCGFVNPGNLVKTGTGTLTLNGVNSYTGFTEVQQGTLVINGSITSNTTVFPGAILGGDGTIFGNLTINANGTLAPGNSIGTITINGNATFNNGAIYSVEVTPSAADRTNVTGTATINGGNVQVTSLAPQNTYSASHTYTIVNATGGVNGQFTSVSDNLALYNSALSYDGSNVYLTLTLQLDPSNPSNPARPGFTPFATSPNTMQAALALNRSDINSALIQAMLGFTDDQLRAALPYLTGEFFGSMSGALIDESRLAKNAILSRLRNTGFSGYSGALGYLSVQQEEAQALAYAPRRNNPFNAMRPADRGFDFWTQAFGSWARYDADSNAATAKRSTGGFLVGADKIFGESVRAGLSAGYSSTNTSVAARAARGEADTFHVAGYLSKRYGNFSLRSGGVLSLHSLNSERTALGSTLRADYTAATGQIFGEIGYAMTMGQIAFEPFANLSLVHHYTNAFTETGGVAALTTNGYAQTNPFSTLGIRFATRYTLSNGWTLNPQATFGWQHAFGDLAPLATLAFQNTGTGFTVAGTPLARDTFLTEAGLDLHVSPTQTLGFFYAATLAGDATEQSIRGKYQWRF